jgi:hypothetical protein
MKGSPSPFRARICMPLLSIALLLTPASSPALIQTSRAKTPTTPAAEMRNEMISTAAQIVRSSDSLSRIWPGYWPEDQAFIIHADGVGALLISPGARPASFEPMPDPALPEELKGRAYFHEGTLGGASRPFVIGYPIGDGKTALLANREPDPMRTITLILHEQFHGYQAKAFKGGERQFVDPLAVKDRVSFAAAAEVERSFLSAALSKGNAGAKRQLLQQYFAVRREREQAMPAEVVKVEQGFERSEGTARYVDMAGRSMVAGGGEAQMLSLLDEALQQKLATQTGAFSTIWFRTRSYATGAALTYLISKSGVPDWRAEIESGATPDLVLERIVGRLPQKERRNLAKAARNRFGYQAKLRELEPLIRAAERGEIKSVSEFLALAPYQVAIDLGAAGASARPGFHAKDMTLLSPSTTALPVAFRFNASGDSFSITSKDLPVLMESRRYTILLKSAPTIEGLGPLPSSELRLEKLKLSGEGLDVTVDRPVIVSVAAPNRLVLKLIE